MTDVADAMMMQRLFSNLFSNNVTVISTSNREPDDLYRDGVQRDRFVPFIHLLKAVGDSYDDDDDDGLFVVCSSPTFPLLSPKSCHP